MTRTIGMFVVGLALLAAAGAKIDSARSSSTAGGVVRVDNRSDFDFLDPGLAYFSHSWNAVQMTCSTLVMPSRNDVLRGATRLVPDGAAALPKISKDGRTYTFTIRKGNAFNTGEPVTAANYAYPFTRNRSGAFSSPAPTFMGGIASVKATGKYALQIKLGAPNGDLLGRLAMPFFCAVPTSTPAEQLGVVPAASGPYYVASWDKGRQAVFKRNTHYKGPRPHVPDEIVFNIGIALDAQQLRAERGDTDVAGFPPANAATLAQKYGVNVGAFQVRPQQVFWYLNLNREGHLFRGNDKLAVAVNYAIDRPAMVAQHGAYGGIATDQIVPSGVPGRRDLNLYPLNGPDLSKARALAQGNTRDGKCVLWTFNASFGPSVALVVQKNLKEIGIACDIVPFDRVVQTTKAGTRGANYDILLNGTGYDYLDAGNFITRLFYGRFANENNINLSYYNNTAFNKQMLAAGRLTGAKRYAAFAKVEQAMMKTAPPVAPYVQTNGRFLVSARVACFNFVPGVGVDFGALCPR